MPQRSLILKQQAPVLAGELADVCRRTSAAGPCSCVALLFAFCPVVPTALAEWEQKRKIHIYIKEINGSQPCRVRIRCNSHILPQKHMMWPREKPIWPTAPTSFWHGLHP